VAAPFYSRLRKYYLDVAAVLRGEAQAASIFPNTTDIGMSRERVYAEFLKQHAPSKCNVVFGGFLFGEDGSESGQLDVLVTTDTAPRFDFQNQDGFGKTFSPVEGTLAVASIKSTLDKKELVDALTGIAKIPPTKPLDGRANPTISIKNYDDWPYKIIYASDAISLATLMQHLTDFYANNTNIPISRRPDLIHVSGQYVIIRARKGAIMRSTSQQRDVHLEEGVFYPFTTDPDLQGMLWVLEHIQQNATASAHIIYSYTNLIDHVNGLTSAKNSPEPIRTSDPS